MHRPSNAAWVLPQAVKFPVRYGPADPARNAAHASMSSRRRSNGSLDTAELRSIPPQLPRPRRLGLPSGAAPRRARRNPTRSHGPAGLGSRPAPRRAGARRNPTRPHGPAGLERRSPDRHRGAPRRACRNSDRRDAALPGAYPDMHCPARRPPSGKSALRRARCGAPRLPGLGPARRRSSRYVSRHALPREKTAITQVSVAPCAVRSTAVPVWRPAFQAVRAAARAVGQGPPVHPHPGFRPDHPGRERRNGSGPLRGRTRA